MQLKRFAISLITIFVFSLLAISASSCGPVFPSSKQPLDSDTMVSVQNAAIPTTFEVRKNDVQSIRVVNIANQKGANYHLVPGPDLYLVTPMLSPDRKCIAFEQVRAHVATDIDKNGWYTDQIITMPARGGPADVLFGVGKEDASSTALIGWMPGSQELWYTRGFASIYTIDSRGKTDTVTGFGPIDSFETALISPDGRHLAMVKNQGPPGKAIAIADIEGHTIQNPRELYTSDRLNQIDSYSGWATPSMMTWIDNNRIAFLELSSDKPSADITNAVWSLDITTGSRSLLYRGPAQVMLTDLTASPDRNKIAFLALSSVGIDQNLDFEYRPQDNSELIVLDLRKGKATVTPAGFWLGGYLNW